MLTYETADAASLYIILYGLNPNMDDSKLDEMYSEMYAGGNKSFGHHSEYPVWADQLRQLDQLQHGSSSQEGDDEE